jgi:hypothetical protein
MAVPEISEGAHFWTDININFFIVLMRRAHFTFVLTFELHAV